MPDSEPKRLWPRLLLIALPALAIVAFVYLKDDPLGDHSDLMPKPLQIAGGDEVFAAWVEAAEKGDEESWHDIDMEFLDSIAGHASLDEVTTAKILEANRGAIEAAFHVDTLGSFTFPQLKNLDDPSDYLNSMMSMAKNLKLFGITHARDGDFVAAKNTALVSLRFSDHQIGGAGSLISLLVAITSQTATYSSVENIIDHGAPDDVLEEFSSALANEPEIGAALRHCIRIEFSLLGGAIDRAKTKDPDQWDDLMDLMDLPHPPNRLLFKRNRTINGFAKAYRELIAASKLLPIERPFALEIELEGNSRRFSSNAFGDYLIGSTTPIFWQMLSAPDFRLANRRLLRTKIAVLRYQIATGSLPGTLNALVPNYFDAVPLDPFDGKPVRYDPTRGAMWVIGQDLIDDGGTIKPDEKGFDRYAPDPTLFVRDAPLEP